ncbi:MAG: bile acid:sodium symporter [Verrucomicrobiales bacterium]|nr:bile acid:sodium symporter [Verrucomicrobiales bacterium]
MTTELAIKILSGAALFTLLFAAGLRLTPSEVWAALRDWRRLVALVIANFVVVPGLTVGAALLFQVSAPTAMAMVLLGAAPFAPVVPVFTRLARADLALAAGLTAVFPVFCTFFTPLACRAGLALLPPSGELKFQTLSILATLLATASAPLALGIATRSLFPETSTRMIRPTEITSEAVGAASLIFVVSSQFRSMLATGWMPILAMVLVSEAALVLGYACGGRDPAARKVTGLGTANRNIALAILVAADSFPGSPVLGGVVANGLLLLLLGLLHVGLWRLLDLRNAPRARR